MRTPFDLQDALCADMEKLFQGFLLRDAGGNLTNLKVYAQDLPETETDDETDTDPAPYCIVKIVDGTAGMNHNSVRVVLVFCVRDAARDRQGHKDILTLIFRVYERFAKNPYIGNFYFPVDNDSAFEWAIQDEDTYPYNIGACKLMFHGPSIQKEDPLV
jgi:hypothetical protein